MLLALALLAAPAGTVSVHVVGPGCLDRGNTSLNVVTSLLDHFGEREGAAYLVDSGLGLLTDGHRAVFHPGDLTDGTLVTKHLAALQQPGTVIDPAFPVLLSPWEWNLQLPKKSGARGGDWLGVMARSPEYPDQRRVVGRLLRHGPLLVVELPGAPPPSIDPLDWTREFSFRTRIQTPDEVVEILSMGRMIGYGPRMKAELARHPGVPLLHTGSLLAARPRDEEVARCREELAAVGLTGIVPRRDDLALGLEGMAALELPWVAANLKFGDERPFPRFLVREVAGRTVVVIGVVGREQARRLTEPLRSKWVVEGPGLAVQRAAEAAREQLGRRPDLTIALAGASGDDYGQVIVSRWVDVVVGGPGRWDVVPRATEVTVKGHATARAPRASLLAGRSPLTLECIEADFDARGELRILRQQSAPVLMDGPIDAPLHRRLRADEETQVPRDSHLLLPDPHAVVEANPALYPLVWGDRIVHQTGTRAYPRSWPARYSDPLWMRFVGNIVRADTGAEVVLLRNLRRTFDMIGPLPRLSVTNWLAAAEPLVRYDVSGAALLRIGARLARQDKSGEINVAHFLFAAGLDPARGRVEGRPIDAKELYGLVTTASAAAEPEVAAALEGLEPEPAGDTRAAVMGVLEGWLDPATGKHRPEATGLLAERLVDASAQIEGRWAVRLDQVAVTGSAYRNTAGAATYADTRETRVTTPDNQAYGVRLDAALVYDGPAVAWETRVKGTLSRVELEIEGVDVPPQEQADDLQAWTELRFNAVRLEVGRSKFPIVPFLRSALDTEFTPVYLQDGSQLPRQVLLLQSAGFVAQPGGWLPEVRLGGLYQTDLSEDADDPSAHHDGGATAGLKVGVPIWGPVAFSAEADVRWLANDDDDRDTDLGLVVAASGKLSVGVFAGFGLFGFGDAFLVRGKTPGRGDVEGSWIAGGGLELSRVFKLR